MTNTKFTIVLTIAGLIFAFGIFFASQNLYIY